MRRPLHRNGTATAIPWDTPFELPGDVEDAVVHLMTYLVENETAALIVPSRFVAQLDPHFREVMQISAIEAADEARHIEVFTRRALLKSREPGLSTAGGQASLQTLVEEPDFATASFLLSALGEGTFLSLLWLIQRCAPDPRHRRRLPMAAQDEARHVAFGMSHLRRHIRAEPAFRETLAGAVRRHHALRHTAGLNAEVFEALVLLAAGSWDPADLIRGSDAVDGLVQEMNRDRVKRLKWDRLPGRRSRRAFEPSHPQLHVSRGPKRWLRAAGVYAGCRNRSAFSRIARATS